MGLRFGMAIGETLVALALGVALAAAVGLRIFVPLMLGVAAALEISAYYIPGVDNLLDAIATPVAIGAGAMMVAAPLWDMPPLLKWTAAIIAGGGTAGLTHGFTSLLRAKSTVTTGGLANPVVASGELAGALGLSLLALAVPVVAVILVAVAIIFVVRMLRRLSTRHPIAEVRNA
jgi:Domain of unknown function (DUF4126)